MTWRATSDGLRANLHWLPKIPIYLQILHLSSAKGIQLINCQGVHNNSTSVLENVESPPTKRDMPTQWIFVVSSKTFVEIALNAVHAYGQHSLGHTQCSISFNKFKRGDFDASDEERRRLSNSLQATNCKHCSRKIVDKRRSRLPKRWVHISQLLIIVSMQEKYLKGFEIGATLTIGKTDGKPKNFIYFCSIGVEEGLFCIESFLSMKNACMLRNLKTKIIREFLSKCKNDCQAKWLRKLIIICDFGIRVA